jgi:hypothetical protein
MQKEIPNLCPKTGISYDYILAFGNLTNYLERVEEHEDARSRHLAKRAFIHRLIPRYAEYFDPQVYENPVNGLNADTVKRIDDVVDKLNSFRLEENTDFEQLSQSRKQLLSLIRGTESTG